MSSSLSGLAFDGDVVVEAALPGDDTFDLALLTLPLGYTAGFWGVTEGGARGVPTNFAGLLRW